MSMHQGIDLSRFKKVASDGKTSTLKHSKGHEIKIAHGALTPKMHEQLKNMPLHLADGTPEGPVEAMPEAPMEAPAPEVQAVPEVIPPKPEPIPDEEVSPENTVVVTGQRPQKTVEQQAQENAAHDLGFQQDMAMGHIAPKTYADLYGKKDTLGKIGTLFGLMIGGAGAGLTHQPNALLGMMDKEIERDLEAQKQSQGNAQNWHRIGLAHAMNQAQIEQMQTGNIGTMANAANTAINADINREKLKRVGGKTALSDALTQRMMSMPDPIHDPLIKNKMNIGAVQTLQDRVNKLPPGQTKALGQHLLDTVVKPGVHAEILKNSAKSAQAKAAAQQSATAQSSSQNRDRPYVVDEDKLNNAIMAGKNDASLDLAPRKNAIDPKLEGTIQDEKSKLMNHRDMAISANESWNKLAKMKLAGQVPLVGGIGEMFSKLPWVGGLGPSVAHVTQDSFENERDRLIIPIMERLGYNMSDTGKLNQIKALMPKWNDSKEERAESHNQLVQHMRDLESKLAPNLLSANRRIKGLVGEFPEMPIEKENKGASGNF